ncbi:hypothetical protein BH10BAC5_BH10BAC5_09910 [soil metagenome]
MIKTVLRNLISNAIKFCTDGCTITIGENKSDKGSHEFFVRDTGKGINDETKEKLFKDDLFYSSEGTNNESGTGLGLILCRDFIRKNGGTLRLESELGKGSTFIFTLPVCA